MRGAARYLYDSQTMVGTRSRRLLGWQTHWMCLAPDEKNILFKDVLYDRMTETFGTHEPDLSQMFAVGKPFPLEVIELSGDAPLEILKAYNKKRGLALDLPEMEYLVEAYKKVGRVSASEPHVSDFSSRWKCREVALLFLRSG